MIDFEGRTAIVTGAGRGIGKSHALLPASRGANVVVNDLGGAMNGIGSNTRPAQEVVDSIRAAGGTALVDTSSVCTAEDAATIVNTAVEAFGGIDILINNAGTLSPRTFPETSAEDLEENLAVHVRGSFNVTRTAWPHLIRSEAPRVVMTTSSAVFGDPELVAYGSAKGGILGLSRNLACAGAGHGIKVNVVAPVAKTRMSDPDPVYDRFSPEDVSAVVAYLAHKSCHLNGEILSCGGGRVARIFLAETQGYGRADITPEDVARNIDEICDERNHQVPKDITSYMQHFLKELREETQV